MSVKPVLYIIAGPNGAGKTTFARCFLPQFAKCVNFVNADLIAMGLSPFSPEKASIAAGRLVLEQIENFVVQKANFGVETTLSGKTYLATLKKIRAAGYEVRVFFLWVPKVALSLARIKQRVASGGHNVPEEDVRRRFERCMHHFFGEYSVLIDGWMLFDNSGDRPRLIAQKTSEELDVIDEDLYAAITKRAHEED